VSDTVRCLMQLGRTRCTKQYDHDGDHAMAPWDPEPKPAKVNYWTHVHTDGFTETFEHKLPHGNLVRVLTRMCGGTEYSGPDVVSEAMTFVPEPDGGIAFLSGELGKVKALLDHWKALAMDAIALAKMPPGGTDVDRELVRDLEQRLHNLIHKGTPR